jgi:hypothetical protein
MTRGPKYDSVIDLPEDERVVGAINAYEINRDRIRVACQVSDEDETVGQLALLDISMSAHTVRVEKTFDDIYMSYSSDRGLRDIVLMVGNIVQARTDAEWDETLLEADFLIEAFTLDGIADFAIGASGEIFRRPAGGIWQRDPVPTTERIMAIHGTSLDDLCAVGGGGTVLRMGGAGWIPIDIGVGTELRCVLSEPDRVILAGDGGIAGQIVGDEFIVFETGIDSDILSICRFKGDLYFADSEVGIHRLKGTKFIPVLEFGYVYRLNSGQHWMTATSSETVLQFNGTTWRGIELGHATTYTAEPIEVD